MQPVKASRDMPALSDPTFRTVLVKTPNELRAALRLRYDVFITEMGGDGPLVDHAARLERDRFDEHAAHLLLLDESRPDGHQTVGTYRFMTSEMAALAGQFYCEDEYDLSLLRGDGKRLLELGRSCLHQDYRGGAAMLHLWSALADYVVAHEIDVLFGVASFHGTDVESYAQSLSFLHHHHLAPKNSRVVAKGPTSFSLGLIAVNDVDRLTAVKAMPALIKAYLRLGATIGDGAFVDHAFNTVDVCIILERLAIGELQKMLLAKGSISG